MNNPVYLRLLTYVLSTLPGLIPAAMAGWVAYDPGLGAWGTLHIEVQGMALAIASGLGISGGVFAKWGVK